MSTESLRAIDLGLNDEARLAALLTGSGASLLQVEVAQYAEKVSIRLKGELDLATERILRSVLIPLIEDGYHVELDLTDLRFIDGAGIRVLHDGAICASERGHGLPLRAPSPILRRVLHVTGLERWFTIEEVSRPESPLDPGATPDATLLEELSTMNPPPLSSEVVDSVLGLVIAAIHTDGDADGLTVTLVAENGPRTAAASDVLWAEMDQLQYALGDGPCLEAARTAHQVVAGATSEASAQRWPSLPGALAKRGVDWVVSTPLRAGQGAVGALNLYRRSATPLEGTFGARLQQVADSIGAFLEETRATVPGEGLDRQLDEALRRHHAIATAVGILMGREGVDEAAAYQLLVRFAASAGLPMHELARSMTESAKAGRRPA